MIMGMIDRKLVESFHRINHLDARAPESELKTIFVEARWSEDEIKSALKICEEVSKESQEKKEASKKEEEKDEDEETDVVVDEQGKEEKEEESNDEKNTAEDDKEKIGTKTDKVDRDAHKEKDESTKEKAKKSSSSPVVKRKQRKFWRSEYVGTDIVVDPQAFQISKVVRKREPRHIVRRTFVALGTMLLAVTVAAGVGLGLMWFFEIGPFYIHADSLL